MAIIGLPAGGGAAMAGLSGIAKASRSIFALSAMRKSTRKVCAMSVKKTKIPRAKSEWEERFALQLRLHKIEHSREFKFAPPRKWRADFFISGYDSLVLVEIEGGIWSSERHNRGSGFQNDCLKYNASQLLGYKLLRGTPEMVRSGLLLEQLKQLL